jgi:hypothetical protein
MTAHCYRPGVRTGDALAACLTCGDAPTAYGFALTHAPIDEADVLARALTGPTSGANARYLAPGVAANLAAAGYRIVRAEPID